MSGRDQEFTRYVEVRGGALLRTAMFLCAGDRSAAEDLVQSTLVRAYVAWHRVRDEGARDGYVRRIMVRESYRRADRSTPVLGEPGLVDPHGPVEDRLDLFPLLATLPRQQRAVVVLRYYEDLSERDIADALGCSPARSSGTRPARSPPCGAGWPRSRSKEVPRVATDTDVERVLRDQLHARSIGDPLPERVLTDSLTLGRRAVRRRHRQGLAGSAAALALVAGLAAVTVRDGSSDPEPAPAPPTVTQTPSAEPDSVAPDAWASSLPLGSPPEVPYLAGTAVILPDGTRVETGGTGAGVIGLSVAGLVLLVETETEQPYSFSSRYVLVTDTGELRDLPDSTVGAQEAVISPDGTRFTGGQDIIDIRDLSVVGQVPEEADILYTWTSSGMVYGAGDHAYLWPKGQDPVEIEGFRGTFRDGSELGTDGCTMVFLEAVAVVRPLSGCIGRPPVGGTVGPLGPDRRAAPGRPVHPGVPLPRGRPGPSGPLRVRQGVVGPRQSAVPCRRAAGPL